MVNKQTLPNVVIAGAPKCGTTSLFNWLVRHPRACGAAIKETRFLMDQDSPLLPRHNFHTRGLVGYASLFRQCEGLDVIVDATPDYLYQETARRVIASLDPVPHSIFLLRRPSARVYSLFRFGQHNMAVLDPRITFRQFIEILDGSRPGDLTQGLANAVRHSCYAEYLKPWMQSLPPDRIHWVLLEHLRANPREEVTRLAERIGLSTGFYSSFRFQAGNETRAIRWPRLQRMRRRAGAHIRLGPLAPAAKWLYGLVNVAGTVPPSDDDRAVMRELDARFEKPNRELSAITGLDLSPWS